MSPALWLDTSSFCMDQSYVVRWTHKAYGFEIQDQTL